MQGGVVSRKPTVVFFRVFPTENRLLFLRLLSKSDRNRQTIAFFLPRFSFFGFGLLLKIPTETDLLFGEKPKNRPNHFSLSVHNPDAGCEESRKCIIR